MKWEARWTSRSTKDLRKLDQAVQRRIVAAVERLAEQAVGDVQQLTDVDPAEWRLRVGSWRVRFQKNLREAMLVVTPGPSSRQGILSAALGASSL